MNKTILLILIGAGILAMTPVYAAAFPNPLNANTLSDVVEGISNWLLNFAIILGPVLLVVAGVIFMTAAGDPNRVSTAKRMILWTIVGFLIILLAKGIVSVVKNLLEVP